MKPKGIEIRNESTDAEDRFQLYIDGGPRAAVSKKANLVQLHWEVYGPQEWPRAKLLLQGLLELSVIADQLSGDTRDKDQSDEG